MPRGELVLEIRTPLSSARVRQVLQQALADDPEYELLPRRDGFVLGPQFSYWSYRRLPEVQAQIARAPATRRTGAYRDGPPPQPPATVVTLRAARDVAAVRRVLAVVRRALESAG